MQFHLRLLVVMALGAAACGEAGQGVELDLGDGTPDGATLGGDEPSFVPGMDTLLFEDDMDGYMTTSQLWPPDGASAPQFVDANWTRRAIGGTQDSARQRLLSPGRGGSGTALQLAYDGATQTSLNFITINVPPSGATDTVFVTHWARATISAPLGGTALAVKWIELWHPDVDRIQFNTHDHLPWTGGAQATYWQVYDQGRATAQQATQPVAPYFVDVADGQWHRFTYAFRPNSSGTPGGTTARDGLARMWIDGVKIIDVSAAAVGVTPAGGEKAWCLMDDVDALAVADGIIAVSFAGPQTTATPAWTFDLDDFRQWKRP